MKVFKLNEYLTLKLEEGFTNIYVNGRYFEQCKFLLLNIPRPNVRDFDYIESIDEAAELLDRSLEGNELVDSKFSPEVEFWGHCSNLQAWIENDYDTRLLHSNLAFPLLKELSRAGDPVAHAVFKEEVAKRLLSGFPSVVTFLKEEGYLEEFDKEEQQNVLELIAEKLQSLEKFDEFCEKFILFYNVGYHSLISTFLEVLSDKILNYELSEKNLRNLQELFAVLNEKEVGDIFNKIVMIISNKKSLKLRLALLKTFFDCGVKQARRKLRDELIEIILGNDEGLIQFLIDEGYLKALSKSDMTMFIDFPGCSELLINHLLETMKINKIKRL